ncbi:hypothetical protein M0813_14700 [Anaeramoeba flamelloides]|uniref:Late embryogenesis abundant protein LEA-2 subgroup domain-containing protein n=1 Tax=Anaeramoeba flamelloides TaxID=1746091 RepID=A0AAV7Y5J7_9EUKA|nr:hypothetical protein M0812_30357 [Anaeramoeba flamelloides]KAJ6251926.1 hypothetical protein M0813_14700 [Anaeramoeba flamelloides]
MMKIERINKWKCFCSFLILSILYILLFFLCLTQYNQPLEKSTTTETSNIQNYIHITSSIDNLERLNGQIQLQIYLYNNLDERIETSVFVESEIYGNSGNSQTDPISQSANNFNIVCLKEGLCSPITIIKNYAAFVTYYVDIEIKADEQSIIFFDKVMVEVCDLCLPF